MNGVKKEIKKFHNQLQPLARAIPFGLIFNGKVSETTIQQIGAQVQAKEKMKKQEKTIIQLPAPLEDSSFLPFGYNLVTPTEAYTT